MPTQHILTIALLATSVYALPIFPPPGAFSLLTGQCTDPSLVPTVESTILEPVPVPFTIEIDGPLSLLSSTLQKTKQFIPDPFLDFLSSLMTPTWITSEPDMEIIDIGLPPLNPTLQEPFRHPKDYLIKMSTNHNIDSQVPLNIPGSLIEDDNNASQETSSTPNCVDGTDVSTTDRTPDISKGTTEADAVMSDLNALHNILEAEMATENGQEVDVDQGLHRIIEVNEPKPSIDDSVVDILTQVMDITF